MNILLIIKTIKMILRIKVIVIITIIITIILKWRGRYRMPPTITMELLVTLQNDQKSLSNIKESSPSDAVMSLCTSPKWLIHYLMWWIGVYHAFWTPSLELYTTSFLKKNCNGNINQHNNNNNYNNTNNDNNNNTNNSNSITIRLN